MASAVVKKSASLILAALIASQNYDHFSVACLKLTMIRSSGLAALELQQVMGEIGQAGLLINRLEDESQLDGDADAQLEQLEDLRTYIQGTEELLLDIDEDDVVFSQERSRRDFKALIEFMEAQLSNLQVRLSEKKRMAAADPIWAAYKERETVLKMRAAGSTPGEIARRVYEQHEREVEHMKEEVDRAKYRRAKDIAVARLEQKLPPVPTTSSFTQE